MRIGKPFLCFPIYTTILSASYFCSGNAFTSVHQSLRSISTRTSRNNNANRCQLHLESSRSNVTSTTINGSSSSQQAENDTLEIYPPIATKQRPTAYRSYVSSIRTYNLAGNGADNEITFSNADNLVAITGESGTGKSLLFAKACRLLLGKEKSLATNHDSMDDNPTVSFVSLELCLYDDHRDTVLDMFDILQLNQDKLISNKYNDNDSGDEDCLRIEFKRSFICQNKSSTRTKSVCEVNEQSVTLKTLCTLLNPLINIVDASQAAQALSQPKDCLAMIDTAVKPDTVRKVELARKRYSAARQNREAIEQELSNNNSNLPQSFSTDNQGDFDKLIHWISELDSFESRLKVFRDSIFADNIDDPVLQDVLYSFVETEWTDNASTGKASFSSAFYERLLDLRDNLKDIEERISSAQAAVKELSYLSQSGSALSAIERAKKLIYTASNDKACEGQAFDACEKTHEILNQIESAIQDCTDSIDDDDKGLIACLQKLRVACPCSLEEIDKLLVEWSTLARKQSVTPAQLPSCHIALQRERDGNVEARELLPKAKQDERVCLEEFEQVCDVLSAERKQISERVSTSVSKRLASLGMERSYFLVNIKQDQRKCTDRSVYSSPSSMGVDDVDFMLYHDRPTNSKAKKNVGRVHEMASGGEKARLLLAIECALPGSVSVSNDAGRKDSNLCGLSPLMVLYDEIDAHVGGRAANAIANMLVQQSRTANQVFTITHSPSVAAVADTHIVVESGLSIEHVGDNQQQTSIVVKAVDGIERQRELARMASGDLASDEALRFAQALLESSAKVHKRYSV